LNKYLGPDDPRYITLRSHLRTLLQEFVFFSAVNANSEARLVDILEHGHLDPDEPRFHGQTALHIATRKELKTMIEKLLLYDADMSIRTADEKTAIEIAAERLDKGTLEFLLENGARRDTKCHNGKTLIELVQSLTTEEDPEESKARAQAIINLLENPPLVHAPKRTQDQRKRHHGASQDGPRPPPYPYGEKACITFQITVANFFQTKTGEEVFDIRTPTVHEVLYRTTPKDICRPVMKQAQNTEDVLEKKCFSWYHVPANNVSIAQNWN
jgi:hypothetical protein